MDKIKVIKSGVIRFAPENQLENWLARGFKVLGEPKVEPQRRPRAKADKE